MNSRPDLRMLDEQEGTGPAAQRGDWVTYNLRAFLEGGRELPVNALAEAERKDALARHPASLRAADGCELINFVTRLGSREACAGVEHALEGMREGGYRKVEAGPHLAYGEQGIPGSVPAGAAVVFDLWLRRLRPAVRRTPGQTAAAGAGRTAEQRGEGP